MAEESLQQKVERYERTLKAISTSKLTGVAFGDWVQSACEDTLEGFEAECPECGTAVHDGECVKEAA